MLSVTNNWLSAFDDSRTPLVLIAVISTGTGAQVEGTNQFTFTSALNPAARSWMPPADIIKISGMSAEIDPIKRTFSVGQGTIEFTNDCSLISLLTQASPLYLRGKTVTLYIGTPQMAVGDLAPAGQFVIDDVKTGTEKTMLLTLRDPYIFVDAQNFDAGYVSAGFQTLHPMEIMRGTMVSVGMPTANIGSNFTAANLPSGLGHLCVSRFSNGKVWTPGGGNASNICTDYNGGITGTLNARDICNQLALLMGGSIFTDENGVIQYVPFSLTAAAVDNWVTEDILELTIWESYRDLCNRVLLNFGSQVRNSALWAATNGTPQMWLAPPSFSLEDVASETRYIGPGNATGVFLQSFSTPWLTGMCRLDSFSGGTGTGGTMVLQHAALLGVAGCRAPGNTTVPGTLAGWNAPPSWAQLGAPQQAYFVVSGKNFVGGGTYGVEILQCNAAGPLTVPGQPVNSVQADQGDDGLYRATDWGFTVSGRGLFGSTALDWAGSDAVAFDVTIPILTMFQNILRRCNDGLPKLRVVTHLRKWPIQIGDIVTVNDQRGFVLGHTLDGTVKFEVLAKQPVFIDNQPHIEWLLGAVEGINGAGATLTQFQAAEWFIGL